VLESRAEAVECEVATSRAARAGAVPAGGRTTPPAGRLSSARRCGWSGTASSVCAALNPRGGAWRRAWRWRVPWWGPKV